MPGIQYNYNKCRRWAAEGFYLFLYYFLLVCRETECPYAVRMCLCEARHAKGHFDPLQSHCVRLNLPAFSHYTNRRVLVLRPWQLNVSRYKYAVTKIIRQYLLRTYAHRMRVFFHGENKKQCEFLHFHVTVEKSTNSDIHGEHFGMPDFHTHTHTLSMLHKIGQENVRHLLACICCVWHTFLFSSSAAVFFFFLQLCRMYNVYNIVFTCSFHCRLSKK